MVLEHTYRLYRQNLLFKPKINFRITTPHNHFLDNNNDEDEDENGVDEKFYMKMGFKILSYDRNLTNTAKEVIDKLFLSQQQEISDKNGKSLMGKCQ